MTANEAMFLIVMGIVFLIAIQDVEWKNRHMSTVVGIVAPLLFSGALYLLMVW